jgi:hypothetical protein
VLPRGRKLKRGPTEICAAEKIGDQIFFKYAKKRAEKGPNFFEGDYSYQKPKISAEKYTLSLDIFDFSSPIPREKVCKRQFY